MLSPQRDLEVRTEILLGLKHQGESSGSVIPSVVGVMLREMAVLGARMKMGMKKCLGKWIWMILQLMGCWGSKSSLIRQKTRQVTFSPSIIPNK